LCAKGLNAKDINKEMFSVYGGKCLSRKAVRDWVGKFSQGRAKVAGYARPGAEMTEISVKRLLGCGFRRTGIRDGTNVSMLGEDVWRNNFYPDSNITLYVLYPFKYNANLH
jgi:hypothetical protein